MIDATQFRSLIVKPTLGTIGLWSQSAEELLMGTAACESDMGTYIKQLNGPALSPYGIEPATFADVWKRINTTIKQKIMDLCQYTTTPNQFALMDNLTFATCIARIKYFLIPEPLPSADDVEGLANYYKKYYNTDLGKGSAQSFIDKYNKYCR